MFSTDSAEDLPPTAGLPLRWGDLTPSAASHFSTELAAFLGVPAVGVECSGTGSLTIILAALKRLSPLRRAVVIPAYSCPLVVFAAAQCGLEARICDTVPGGFDLDPAALARLCDHDTLAVIPTHLGGRVAALGPVIDIARQAGAYVVEDAAQALGAREHGQSVGLRSDAAFFSLSVGKGLTLFEGGVWMAANEDLHQEIARTSAQIVPRRFPREVLRCLQLVGYAALYNPRGLHLAYGQPLRRALRKGDLITAAGDYFPPGIPLHRISGWRQGVGSRALQRLPAFQQALAEQARIRLPRLQAIPGLHVLTDDKDCQGVWPLFMAVMPDQERRDAAIAQLWGAGLGVSRMFIQALSDYDYLRPWLGTQSAPNAGIFAECMLTISNSLWLDDRRFERVLNVLAEICR
jgi:dTDP-4-amino-4,6-dideoxygalactose transaminase